MDGEIFWHSLKKFLRKEEKRAKAFAEYEETLLAKWGYRFLKAVFGPVVRWLWIKEVRGLENIPKEGALIIASNHASYFDFFCFMAASPRNIHYLAAEKFLYSRFWRALVKLTGQIVVDRRSGDKSEAQKLVLSLLRQRRIFGIFPEGTRSRTGRLQKPYTGVAKFAIQSRAPVIPVGIFGTYEIMPAHAKIPRLKKVCHIRIGKPIYIHDHYALTEAEGDEKLYEKITHHIMKEVASLCGQDYPFEKETLKRRDAEKEVVIFDLDNTLVKGQSQKLFIRYLFKKKLISFRLYLKLVGWFMFYRLGLFRKPQKIMQKTLLLFKGLPVKEISRLVDDFFDNVLEDYFFPSAQKWVDEHRRKRRFLVLASSAIAPIARKAASFLRIPNVVSTELKVSGDAYTGEVDGKIAEGEDKARMVKDFLSAKGYSSAVKWVYSDHISDLPLLKLADNPVVVNPDASLFWEARRRGWYIMLVKE